MGRTEAMGIVIGRVGMPGAVRAGPMSMGAVPCLGTGGAGSAGAVADQPFIGLSRFSGWQRIRTRPPKATE